MCELALLPEVFSHRGFAVSVGDGAAALLESTADGVRAGQRHNLLVVETLHLPPRSKRHNSRYVSCGATAGHLGGGKRFAGSEDIYRLRCVVGKCAVLHHQRTLKMAL